MYELDTASSPFLFRIELVCQLLKVLSGKRRREVETPFEDLAFVFELPISDSIGDDSLVMLKS